MENSRDALVKSGMSMLDEKKHPLPLKLMGLSLAESFCCLSLP